MTCGEAEREIQMKVLLIIPAYNEEGNIQRVLENLWVN